MVSSVSSLNQCFLIPTFEVNLCFHIRFSLKNLMRPLISVPSFLLNDVTFCQVLNLVSISTNLLISKFSTKDSKKSNLKPSENIVEEKSNHGLQLEGKVPVSFSWWGEVFRVRMLNQKLQMFCGQFTEKLNSPNWVFCFCGLLFFFSLARLNLMT